MLRPKLQISPRAGVARDAATPVEAVVEPIDFGAFPNPAAVAHRPEPAPTVWPPDEPGARSALPLGAMRITPAHLLACPELAVLQVAANEIRTFFGGGKVSLTGPILSTFGGGWDVVVSVPVAAVKRRYSERVNGTLRSLPWNVDKRDVWPLVFHEDEKRCGAWLTSLVGDEVRVRFGRLKDKPERELIRLQIAPLRRGRMPRGPRKMRRRSFAAILESPSFELKG